MCRVRTTRVAVSAGCGFPARCTSFASCAMILDAGGEADENDDDDDEEEEEEEEEKEESKAPSLSIKSRFNSEPTLKKRVICKQEAKKRRIK